MKHTLIALAALAFVIIPLAAKADGGAPRDHKPARAYFVNIKDGDTVPNPLRIVFGLEGMKVAPAGTHEPDTGHFHLLIDTQMTDEEKQLPIAKDEQHLHFGKGQTETTIDLEPGEHTLQLVMGDGDHMLHNPPVMSDVIHVTVE